ncbi:unnamed protein product [Schistocephalus solidus]|uniref:Reverse transcriptase domain-containing protein n=1 Tax=Schistocephalus solidus TaxID=70667 RepID=A0A183SSE3_SCHSO|nr:unnamed protein product [Schistocephalus solidus]
MLSKLDELKIHVCDISPEIINLTETLLSQHVDDREFTMAGYQLFRKDRKERRGSGVFPYVKSELTVLDKTYKLTSSSEAIWLSIKVPGSSSLDVLTVYRPPRRDPVADAYLLEELEKIATRFDILIMGDYNTHHIDWSSACAHSSDLAFDGCLLSTKLKLLLTQHVTFPIRVCERQQANCLDLVPTKSQDSIDEVSCLPPLERWNEIVDIVNTVHAVYIDFKKAFDSVPHHRLLYRLNRIGVRGSVLGPILFIVYINDCANELDCDIAMFADDLKLWCVIQTAADEENLQANLNRLHKWPNCWLLPYNESKCNIIRFGKSNPSNRTVYRLNDISLKEVDAQKDLGFWITPSLKLFLHCAKVAKSAMSILYLAKRAFAAFTTDCFAQVFGTFVWPQLESAIQAWRPWVAKGINISEKVQRRATKLVLGRGSQSYETRLSNLNLFSLRYRQLQGDLILTFRIICFQGIFSS